MRRRAAATRCCWLACGERGGCSGRSARRWRTARAQTRAYGLACSSPLPWAWRPDGGVRQGCRHRVRRQRIPPAKVRKISAKLRSVSRGGVAAVRLITRQKSAEIGARRRMRLLGLVLLGAAPSPAHASVKGAVGSRAVAQAVLVRTARDAAYADRALESELRKARPPLTPADAKHATAVVYGVMRQRAYLDFALGQLAGPDVADRSDERTIAALRIGAFELLVSARPPHRPPHPSPHRQSHVARSHRTRATGAVHAHATTRRRQLSRRARETQGRARFRQRRAAQPLETAGAQLPPDSRPYDCHLLAIPTLARRRARSLSPRPPCLPSTPSPRAPTCPSGCSLRCDRCYPRTRT